MSTETSTAAPDPKTAAKAERTLRNMLNGILDDCPEHELENVCRMCASENGRKRVMEQAFAMCKKEGMPPRSALAHIESDLKMADNSGIEA